MACTTLAAGAAPAKPLATEKSPDVLLPQQARKSVSAREPLLLAPSAVAAAAAPTIEDVGDADSFGRNVTYLGLAQTMSVTVLDDCSTSDPTVERCIVANAAPAPTTFDRRRPCDDQSACQGDQVADVLRVDAVHPGAVGKQSGDTGDGALLRQRARHHRQRGARRSDAHRPGHRPAVRRRVVAWAQHLHRLPHPSAGRDRPQVAADVAVLHRRHHQQECAGRGLRSLRHPGRRSSSRSR